MDLVNRYAAALSLHPTPVEAVGEVAGELLERFADTSTMVIGTHFGTPSGCHVHRDGSAFRLSPAG